MWRRIRLCLAWAAMLVSQGCSSKTPEFAAPPPVPVTVAHPLQQPVNLFLEQNGETEAANRAEVRARVRGFLQAMPFQPGDEVEAGEVLFKIEPDLYSAEKQSADAALSAAEAAILVAQATVEAARAELNRAERDLVRQQELLATKTVAQADYDTVLAQRDSAASALRAAEAGVAAAEAEQQIASAGVVQAELNLGYTTVAAPISGKVSKTAVKLGNLVDNGTALATVVNTNEIFANFSINDRDLMRLKEAAEAETRAVIGPEGRDRLPERSVDEQPSATADEKTSPAWRGKPIYLQREGDTSWMVGSLDYVDQEGIDADTGSFALRAVFDNSDGKLLPGLFVRVRLPTELKQDAILIPTTAVVRNQLGTFVLTVDSTDLVQQRAVILGQQIDGWSIVEEGLTVDDRLIVNGLQRARDGDTVKAKVVELDASGSMALSTALEYDADVSRPEAARDEADMALGDAPNRSDSLPETPQ